MFVLKRDNSKEEFNPEKIQSAIHKAFSAAGVELSIEDKFNVVEFCNSLDRGMDLSVEEIQDKVERFLMENPKWFDVGKAYMLYREQHKQARLIKDKLNYIHKYTTSEDSATNLSNTDDNANSNKKNAAARKKKRIHIRQETRAGEDGVRMLSFDIEFRCKERRFEK